LLKRVNGFETEMYATEPEELIMKTSLKKFIPLAAAILLMAGTVSAGSWNQNLTNEPASSLATFINGSVWLLLSGGFAVIGVGRKLTQPN
jgi:hypothetical protein